ncbi:SDR family oxidoreductase [Pseudohongiella acticola]|jgi:NAD(P)-dependent dehydrogenase (short-subunit alcohol dehydrogenase family)|uniref:SDR family oxidoreductase n=1 Tax=Pseudohongiella acticola TaxID=1524254 RepID=UPI003C6DE661
MDKSTLPPQHQNQRPGREEKMQPRPDYYSSAYRPAGKLTGKVAIVTGADSGIGRAVAVYFAREGADVVMLYLEEHEDAELTRREVELSGREALMFAGDVADAEHCKEVIKQTLAKFGQIDVLVNNAGEQHPQQNLEDISDDQLEKTFSSNIFAMFRLTRAVLPHMRSGASIINTTSITAYKGNPVLIDYSATKGAVTSFTRSLSLNLAERGIRVNGVAPGPVWTPLIPSTFEEDTVSTFGANTPLGRPGQPSDLGPAYVYLACDDSSYMTGQVLHLNGGSVING